MVWPTIRSNSATAVITGSDNDMSDDEDDLSIDPFFYRPILGYRQSGKADNRELELTHKLFIPDSANF